MILHRIKRIIVRDRLDEPNRRRDLNYKRIILANKLRNEGMCYVDIGNLMGRDHSTVVYMVKNYLRLKSYKDFRILEKRYITEIAGKTLEEEVIQCENMEDFLKLKIKVLKSIE